MILIDLLYLFAAVLFILGLKQLTKVKTAKKGNRLAALGMLVAVATTLYDMHLKGTGIGVGYIIAGVVIGGLIGIILARTIKMTAMPELVAMFNGFGGGASLLVALSYYAGAETLASFDFITVLISIVIGVVTFTGSAIAFSKLRGILPGKPIIFKGNNLLNLVLFVAIIVLALRAFNEAKYEA